MNHQAAVVGVMIVMAGDRRIIIRRGRVAANIEQRGRHSDIVSRQ